MSSSEAGAASSAGPAASTDRAPPARPGIAGLRRDPAAPKRAPGRRRTNGELPRLPVRARYGVAVGATALALVASLVLGHVARGIPFLFFFASVMLTGWVAGAGPGALAVVLGAALSAYFLLPPYHTFALRDRETFVRLGLFVLVASLINVLNGARWRALARAEAAARARDEFLSIAAHELKTPLTALKLRVQRFARRGDGGRAAVSDAELLETATTLGRQVERLERLVENLLDVTQLTNGRLALDLGVHDVAAIARETVATLEDTARRARTEVTVDAPATAPARCDRARIEQVVFNLVSNAIKYGRESPVTVRVRATDRDVQLAVHDGGIGIAPADAARIFEPFERAVSARNYGGLGMGLHVTREIVAAHGGEVTVESTPDAGATFTVRLPRG